MKKSIFLSLIISLSFFIGVSAFADIPAWSDIGSYNQGQLVVYEGNIYEANYLNQLNPDTAAFAWTLIGPANAQQTQINHAIEMPTTLKMNNGDILTIKNDQGNTVATYNDIRYIGDDMKYIGGPQYEEYNVYSFSLENGPISSLYFLENMNIWGYSLWDNNTLILPGIEFCNQRTYSCDGKIYQLFSQNSDTNYQIVKYSLVSSINFSSIQISYTDNYNRQQVGNYYRGLDPIEISGKLNTISVTPINSSTSITYDISQCEIIPPLSGTANSGLTTLIKLPGTF